MHTHTVTHTHTDKHSGTHKLSQTHVYSQIANVGTHTYSPTYRRGSNELIVLIPGRGRLAMSEPGSPPIRAGLVEDTINAVSAADCQAAAQSSPGRPAHT